MSSASTITDTAEGERKAMPRGRRPKATPSPTKIVRSEKVREAIMRLPDQLRAAGFETSLPSPGPITTISNPIRDSKTSGWIGHVEEPLGILIQRVSVAENFSQRPPFDHANDPIYRRLIKDFITGAAMPESKIAALRREANRKVQSLDEAEVYYSIIDGLQRQYCYGLAVLLVWRGEQNVADGFVTQEAWDFFSEAVEDLGDATSATANLLARTMRYEVFYDIDLEGLLHYMVTFNTAQRRMSLDVQLEIMRTPLVSALESAGIPVYHDIKKMPGAQRPRDKFAASDLILATQAFVRNNPQVTAGGEAERVLNENQPFLDNVGEISDVEDTLKRIALEIHPEAMRAYADDPTRRYLFSYSETFFVGLVAACGYVRNRNNMKMLDGALDKLVDLARRPGEDPLNLGEYFDALKSITSSRGKAMRRLVYDTFLRFFNGATIELEWKDTAAQITGGL